MGIPCNRLLPLQQTSAGFMALIYPHSATADNRTGRPMSRPCCAKASTQALSGGLQNPTTEEKTFTRRMMSLRVWISTETTYQHGMMFSPQPLLHLRLGTPFQSLQEPLAARNMIQNALPHDLSEAQGSVRKNLKHHRGPPAFGSVTWQVKASDFRVNSLGLEVGIRARAYFEVVCAAPFSSSLHGMSNFFWQGASNTASGCDCF